MNDILIPSIPSDPKEAMYVICLYMAQAGEPENSLGYFTQGEALDDLAKIFGVPRRTFKNERDFFDRFTDGERKGFKKETIEPRLANTFKQFNHLGKTRLLEISREILRGIDSSRSFTYLPDLVECRQLSHANIVNIDTNKIFDPSNKIMREIVRSYEKIKPRDNVSIVGSAIIIDTEDNKAVTISTQEFPRCWAVKPTVLGLQRYKEKLNELKAFLKNEGFSQKDITNNFSKLPRDSWEKDLENSIVISIKNIIENSLALTTEDKNYFYKFIASASYSLTGRKLDRGDYDLSAVLKTGEWLGAASDRRPELSLAIEKVKSFEKLMKKSQDTWHVGGENRIYYGAPGTGKSYKIDGIIKDRIWFRTVFHPDLQNSDFFGCLKPRMNENHVNYEFAPGPFMSALAEAYNNRSEHVYLVIEELNRAPAAAVFGDLFLLLDRDDNGKGEYNVDFLSPESREWFANETDENYKKIRIPSNLYIYASMNSADQGVFPIDTAFRRRWQQEYLPLDYTNGPVGKVSYIDENSVNKIIEWKYFVEALNVFLTLNDDLSISEDRLVGQWFIKDKELNGEGIPEKILLYLWDDLLRHQGREYLFSEEIKTYGALAKAAGDHKHFLSNEFLEHLNKITKSDAEV